MGYTTNRRRATAYALTELSPNAKRLGRSVQLTTGRGDLSLTPAEALDLAAELTAAAEAARTTHTEAA